ncbi:hypothetical protein ABZ759_04355 [Streptomyces sp. NPDC047860]|uniref:hypothetical protein n=1 Tax=Streptomyces sp. NPDC047860 TaxID=3155743 RepID=UPI0033D2A968
MAVRMNGMPGELRLRDVLEASALRLLAAADLRALLPSASGVAAAQALWAVEGDPEAGLPVLLAALDDPTGRARRAAAEALGRLGPAGRPGLPGLRRLTRSADRGSGHPTRRPCGGSPESRRPRWKYYARPGPRTRTPVIRPPH